jgi:hypothetical protein
MQLPDARFGGSATDQIAAVATMVESIDARRPLKVWQALLHNEPSYPRMRVSSTPRHFDLNHERRGILDHPLSRMMTAESVARHGFAFQTATIVIASSCEAIHACQGKNCFVADAPRKDNRTHATTSRHGLSASRGEAPELCEEFCALFKQRAWGMPGARCTRSLERAYW